MELHAKGIGDLTHITIMDFTLYQLFFDFVVYSFLGYLGRVLFTLATTGKFVNTGFLNGPYYPLFGAGVVLFELLLSPMRNHIVLMGLGAMVIAGGLEYAAGYVLEKIFGEKWWDYSAYPFQIRGYICLKSVMLYGLLGVLVIKAINPIVHMLTSKVPIKAGYLFFLVFTVVVAVDLLLTVWAILGLRRKLRHATLQAVLHEQAEQNEGEGQTSAAVEGEAGSLPEEHASVAAGDGRQDGGFEAAAASPQTQPDLKPLGENVLQKRLLEAYPSIKSKVQAQQLTAIRDKIVESTEALTEKRHREVIARYEKPIPEGAEKPFAYGLCFTKLFWVFFIGCFAGFLVETVWCLVTAGHFELRVGVVYGPFIPVYGFGAVLITLVLYRAYKKRELYIFLSSMLIGGAFEYACSLFQELSFGTVSWEYSETPLNFGGRTNLTFAFFWGILGLVWVHDFYPVLSSAIEKIPKKAGTLLTVFLCLFMTYNLFISSAAVYRQTERREGKPAENAFDAYLDERFDDDFLKIIYPNMRYVGKEKRGQPPPSGTNRNPLHANLAPEPHPNVPTLPILEEGDPPD